MMEEIQKNGGIVLEHLEKKFGRDAVFSDVCLRIMPGESCGIVGNNGSGKTVLMKCICGFLRPDGGQITVNGSRVGVDCDFPRETGVIIETPGFLPTLSGYRNLKILADLRALIGKKEILETLARVGLDPGMRKPVGRYSLGMRQRLGIAQAIMENPKALILDEPFNGLDKKGTADMRELVKELKAQGTVLLLASHNPGDIEELCDVVHEMEEWK